MTIFLGKPGELETLRSPRSGVGVEIARQSTPRETIGGGRVVDYAPGVLRTWTFAYTFLPPDDRAILLAFYAGHNGPGPWVLLDDGERNWLTVDHSSAGSAMSSTDGFSVSGGQLVSAGWGVPRGPRQLAWDLDGVGSASLSLDPPMSSWYGYPSVPGQMMRWQTQITAANGLNVTISATLTWVDVFGNTISVDSSAGVTATETTTTLYVTAACPAYGAYVVPGLSAVRASGGSVRVPDSGPAIVGPGFGPSLMVDRPQLWMPAAGDTDTDWVPGLGVALVSLPTWEHTTIRVPRSDNTLSLMEVR